MSPPYTTAARSVPLEEEVTAIKFSVLDFYGMCGVVRLCVCWMLPECCGCGALLNSSTPNDVADLELCARLQHLKSNLTLALDRGGRATEPLPALVADKIGRAERSEELVFHRDPVSADTAAKPCGERLLVGERAGVHGTKLRREQFGVAAPDAKCDQRLAMIEHLEAALGLAGDLGEEIEQCVNPQAPCTQCGRFVRRRSLCIVSFLKTLGDSIRWIVLIAL